MLSQIDTTFDFQTETRCGDPDKDSPTLCIYHKLLWSKPLPNGKVFLLRENNRIPRKLYHNSDLGEFTLTSDSLAATLIKRDTYQYIIQQLPNAERDEFYSLASTFGGMIIFPGNMINGMPTINAVRGLHPKISDRFDLTLECIRRYYLGENSPLFEVLDRYRNFFELFETFKGYVDFFLLQDLVAEDYTEVKFFLPFNNFQSKPMPETFEDYIIYKNSLMTFLKNRNGRITKYAIENGMNIGAAINTQESYSRISMSNL
jgi:Family of unknown function (DUF6994)